MISSPSFPDAPKESLSGIVILYLFYKYRQGEIIHFPEKKCSTEGYFEKKVVDVS